ncbi:MAG: KOW domain-containing RNA-binding protein [Eubacteriales bacterium]|nr:KOW domain-containing RNA-binding protein [Eubacteriales bacterium]
MMQDARISDIVVPLCGRDSGRLMLVVGEEGKFLLLANGKNRRFERPKRKKRRHTEYRAPCDGWTREKLLGTGRLSNNDVRKALALYAADIDSEERGE